MAINNPTDISNCVLWTQAKATATLFQNVAGTTPVTADAQPVGTWNDQSGGAFNLTAAADDTTRPTYNVTAGVPWVTFDGSNDVLRRLASLGLYAAGACSIFVAARGNPANDARLIGNGSSASNSPFYAVQAGNGVGGFVAAQLGGFIRNDANAGVYTTGGNARVVIAEDCWDNTDRVIGWVDDGANITGWRDGVEKTPNAYTRSGTLTLDRFSLGALVRTGVGNFFAARVYEIALYTKALSDTEAGDLSTYLANAFLPDPTRKPGLTTLGAG